MIISRKRFEKEIEAARAVVLKEVDNDRRFSELNNRIYDMERRMYELGYKIEKLQAAENEKMVVDNDGPKCNIQS